MPRDIIAEIEASLRIEKRPPGAVTVAEMARRTRTSEKTCWRRLEAAVKAGDLNRVVGRENGSRTVFYAPAVV